MHRTLAALLALGLAAPALAQSPQTGSIDQPSSGARIDDPSAGFEQSRPADLRTGDASEGNTTAGFRAGPDCPGEHLSGSMDDADVPQAAEDAGAGQKAVKPVTGAINPGPGR